MRIFIPRNRRTIADRSCGRCPVAAPHIVTHVVGDARRRELDNHVKRYSASFGVSFSRRSGGAVLSGVLSGAVWSGLFGGAEGMSN